MYPIPKFAEFPELVTSRLRLRELRRSDADAILRVFSDEEVTRYYDLDLLTNHSQAVSLISRQAERFDRGELIRWGIAQQTNDIIIGTIGLVFSPKNSQGGLGYELARPYWRRGIMSEALSIVVRFGFNSLRLNRIQALVMPGNDASAGLLRKAGFIEEGLLREYAFFKGRFQDSYCYSMLKREFSVKKVSE